MFSSPNVSLITMSMLSGGQYSHVLWSVTLVPDCPTLGWDQYGTMGLSHSTHCASIPYHDVMHILNARFFYSEEEKQTMFIFCEDKSR